MATNTDLKNLYDIHGFDVARTQYEGGKIFLHLHYAMRSVRCPGCRYAGVIKNGTGSRTLRLLPTGTRQAYAILKTQRIRCPHGRFNGWLPVPFADPRRTYARAFERYVLDLMAFGTIEHVARHLGVGWDLVKDVRKRFLRRKYDKPSLKNVTRIAIDEFYAGKKTKDFPFVLDLDSGAIIPVGRGKGGEALDAFWKRLRRYKDNIQAVAMDMSGAFKAAVSEHLPNAVVVFDPFHVVKLANEKLDPIRRDRQREAAEADKAYIKGTRGLLLKGAQNLSTEPNPKKDNRSEVELLQEALAFNQPLAAAYYLKEDLRRLWSQASVEAGGAFLDGWIARAEATRLGPLQTLAQTLRRHRAGGWRISPKESPAARWKRRTTRSASSSARPTAYATARIGNCASNRSTVAPCVWCRGEPRPSHHRSNRMRRKMSTETSIIQIGRKMSTELATVQGAFGSGVSDGADGPRPVFREILQPLRNLRIFRAAKQRNRQITPRRQQSGKVARTGTATVSVKRHACPFGRG